MRCLMAVVGGGRTAEVGRHLVVGSRLGLAGVGDLSLHPPHPPSLSLLGVSQRLWVCLLRRAASSTAPSIMALCALCALGPGAVN